MFYLASNAEREAVNVERSKRFYVFWYEQLQYSYCEKVLAYSDARYHGYVILL